MIDYKRVAAEPVDPTFGPRPFAAFRFHDVKVLLRAAVKAWIEHNAPRLGASLAFYTILSLAPLLIVAIAVAGLIFGREAAESQVVRQIQDLVGGQGAQVIRQMIAGARRPANGILATVAGVLILLFGATTVVADLRDALNTIWNVPSRKGGALGSLLRILKERLYYLAVVLGVGLLLLASLMGNAWFAPIGSLVQGWLPLPDFVLQALRAVASFVVIGGLFAVMYKVMPDVSLGWRDVAPGAAFTALLFSVGKRVIVFYLTETSLASTYGPAGPLIVLLVWVYYSAQIFFLGAALTQVFASQYGSLADNNSPRFSDD